MNALTVKWQSASDPLGRATREFVISGRAERPITGALWQPAQPAAGMVLFGHGASGDRYQRPIPALAARFCTEAGWAAAAIDGPVHGLRQVGVGGRVALRDEMRRPTAVDDMVADWLAAIEFLQSVDGIGSRIAYFGLSMGSMFGIPLLAARHDVRVATLGLLGTSGAAQMLRERLLRDAAAIDCPVLFLMQLEDELFPRDGYLELFDVIAATDKRLHANPGLHPEIPQEEIDFAFEFMSARLAEALPRRIVNPLAE
jgi:alpha-beta hydrolase superfamily lysophospholipase